MLRISMGTQLVEGKQKVSWQSTCMLSGLDLLDTLAGSCVERHAAEIKEAVGRSLPATQ